MSETKAADRLINEAIAAGVALHERGGHRPPIDIATNDAEHDAYDAGEADGRIRGRATLALQLKAIQAGEPAEAEQNEARRAKLATMLAAFLRRERTAHRLFMQVSLDFPYVVSGDAPARQLGAAAVALLLGEPITDDDIARVTDAIRAIEARTAARAGESDPA